MRALHFLALGLAFAALAAGPAGASERSIEEALGKWQILCFDDAVGQYRDCYVSRDQLAVLISGRGYELVIVGHGTKREAGSQMSVRVDGRAPIVWREDDLYADEAFTAAVNQFLPGNKALIKWTDGGSGEARSQDVPLSGFTKAYQRAYKLIENYEPVKTE